MFNISKTSIKIKKEDYTVQANEQVHLEGGTGGANALPENFNNLNFSYKNSLWFIIFADDYAQYSKYLF